MIQPSPKVQSLKLGSATQILPIVLGYGTQLLTTPYIVYRLGLHDFGVWSITGAIAQYAGLFDLGVSRAASRYVAVFNAKGDIKSERAVVGICIAVLLTLGSVLGGIALLIPNVISRILRVGNPGVAGFLMLCAVAILIVGLVARVLASSSVGRGRYLAAGIGVAILSTVQAVGGVVALVITPSLTAFATGTVAGTALGLIVVVGVILFDERRIVIGLPVAALAREILSYGVKAQVAAAGDILLLQSGKLVAGILIGPSAAGIYELASRLAMGAQVFGAASGAALTPHLTRSFIAEGMNGPLGQCEHLTRRNTAVAISVPLAIAATASSGIPLWLGSSNHEVIFVLLALLLGITVNLSTALCTSTLMAIGRPALIARAAVASGISQAMFAVAMGYAFGLAGIAIAFAIGVPVVKLIGLWYMQRCAGIPMKLYFRGVRGPYAVGLLATSIAMPIGLLAAPDSRAAAVWPFLAGGAVFVATYCSLGWSRDYLPRLPLPRRHARVESRQQDS